MLGHDGCLCVPKTLDWASLLPKRQPRLVHVRVDVEQLSHARHHQCFKHEALWRGDLDVSAMSLELFVKAHEHPDAGTGDEVQLRAIDDDLANAGVDQRFELFDKPAGSIAVEASVGAEDQDAAIDLVVVELHDGSWRPSYGRGLRDRKKIRVIGQRFDAPVMSAHPRP